LDRIKVILFGMTGFGNSALRVLKEASFAELIAVFTPARENGPYPYYKCNKIQDDVRKSGIPLYEGKTLKDRETYKLILSLSPDLIVVSTFRQIIPRDIISIPRLGVINIHPSLLPRYRGPTPVRWVLANKDKETGVTIHFIEDERIDAGRIISQLKLDILSGDTEGILRKKLAKLSERALSEALPLVINNSKEIFPRQNETEASYYPRYI
jgi:methionyl-tRNA formyltransferase